MGNVPARRMSSVIKAATRPAMHVKCRGTNYPRNESIQRCPVPDDNVSWDVPFPAYAAVDYTAPSVEAQPEWADVDFRRGQQAQAPVKWNEIDGNVNRQSHMGHYPVVGGVPQNPCGRTGICGRGLLGRWGPNHAADPIVTRWKRDEDNQILKHYNTRKPILQFVSIQRKDSGEWALPGGMVDAGETVSATLRREFAEEAMNALEMSEEQTKTLEANMTNFFSSGIEGMVNPGEMITVTLMREFGEEAMNSLEASDDAKTEIHNQVEALFKHGKEVYRGYVDDPRNTDQAWMETVAYNFHDETGTSVGRFRLHAGDDAVGVRWTDIDSKLKLYASHIDFLHTVAERHSAHW